MLFKTLLTSSIFFQLIKSEAIALPEGDALAWADAWGSAIPESEAASEAFSSAYAEAIAIAHPDPLAYAMAASADDCATIACHAACGYLILDGSACSLNKTDTYSGPYNTTCLCSDGSKFMDRYPSCMDCGWTLWKYYGPYVSEALEACSTLSTEPTGTLRCSTTLSESYTKDANAGCEFGGACVTTTNSSGSVESVTATTSADVSKVIASASSAQNSSSSATESSSVSPASSTGSSSASSSASESSASSSATKSSSSSSSSSLGAANSLIAGTSIFGAALLALLI